MAEPAPAEPTDYRPRDWAKVALFALALHLPLFAYPVLRLCHWLDLSAATTVLVFTPLFFSQVIVF